MSFNFFETLNSGVQKLRAPNVLLWVGCLLLIACGASRWLTTPLQGKIRGLSLPFMRAVDLATGLNNPLQVGSYGVILLALGALGIALLLFRVPARLLFFLGGVAVLVCVCFYGNLVFVNSSIVESLVEQNIQAVNIKSFSGTYLSGNSTGLQSSAGLTTDTLWRRMGVGYGYMSFGWFGSLGGAILIMIASWRKQSASASRMDIVGFIVVVLVLSGALSARSVKAEYDRIQGNASLAQGEFHQAVSYFESALRWDPNLIYNPIYMDSLGATYYRLGWHDRPETRMYVGDHYLGGKEFLRAMREFEVAIAQKPDLFLANRKRVEALMALGLDYFGAKSFGAAISSWSEAVRIDPNQVQGHLYLTKAYLENDRLEQGRALGRAQVALEKTADRLVKSDVYNLMGDSYYKQRDFLLARDMYQRSKEAFSLVKILINFNAMKGLQGL